MFEQRTIKSAKKRHASTMGSLDRAIRGRLYVINDSTGRKLPDLFKSGKMPATIDQIR